jgi:hypothetical protein
MQLNEFYDLPIGEREKILEKINGDQFKWNLASNAMPKPKESTLCFGPELVLVHDDDGDTEHRAGQAVLTWNPTGNGYWWDGAGGEWVSADRVQKWQRLARNP